MHAGGRAAGAVAGLAGRACTRRPGPTRRASCRGRCPSSCATAPRAPPSTPGPPRLERSPSTAASWRWSRPWPTLTAATVNDAAMAVVADALRRFYGRSQPPAPAPEAAVAGQPRHARAGGRARRLHAGGAAGGRARPRRPAGPCGRAVGSPEGGSLLPSGWMSSWPAWRAARTLCTGSASTWCRALGSANLTLSNLRGPSFPVYLGGARVTGRRTRYCRSAPTTILPSA